MHSKCFESDLYESRCSSGNDGSTDTSGEICDRFSELDSRIRVFHTENKGAALAKNFGVAQALGEYVLFVDSDDIAENRMVETLHKQVEETGADIVIGNYFIYDENDCQCKFYVLERDFCIEELSAQELINRQAGYWHLNASAFIMPCLNCSKKTCYCKFHSLMVGVLMMKQRFIDCL